MSPSFHLKLFIWTLVLATADAELLSATCGTVFGLLPTQLSDPLNLPGGCAINTCGTPDGTGYFDITCRLLCRVALYSTGSCTHMTGSPITGQCVCTGGLGGGLLLVPPYCAVFGGCACASCGYNGTASCTLLPNGASLNCLV